MAGKRHLYSDDFEACGFCHGRGTVRCSPCNGQGYREVRRRLYDAWGSTTERESCTVCHGTGDRMCNPCGGTGDQRRYGRSEDVDENPTPAEPDADGDADGDDDMPVPSIEQLRAKAIGQFERAHHERENIIEWLWSASDFHPDHKSRIVDWLRGVPLEHPDAERLLKDAAAQLKRNGFTQADTLSMKIDLLAGICGMAQMYNSLPKT